VVPRVREYADHDEALAAAEALGDDDWA